MKYLNLLLLIGLSTFVFSCDDDDDPANPQDANPIYFASDESFDLDDVGEIESIQFSFDHENEDATVVVQLTPEASGNTVAVPVVFEATLNLTSTTKDDDYNWTVQVDAGSTYTQSLKLATGCVDVSTDPGFSAGEVQNDVNISNFIQWDTTTESYYISTAALLTFIFDLTDPGFTLPPGTDPGFGNLPNIYSTSGSIKSCAELPTLFN